MTKKEAIEKTLRVLDEATLNGIPTPEDQIADLRDRAAYFINDAVQWLASIFRIPSTHIVVRHRIKNLIGDSFISKGFMPTECYSAKADARSFCIETSGSVTITVSDKEKEIAKYSVSGEPFTVTKDNINTNGEVSLTVTSAYPFIVRHPALYACAFESTEQIPIYAPYVPCEMPEDFREFDGVYQSSDSIHFREYPDVRRVGTRTYLLPYDAEGQFEFRYWRMAQTVPPDAPDDTELEVVSAAEALIPLHIARALTVGNDETQALSYWIDNRLSTELSVLRTIEKGGKEPIQTIYGVDW